MINLRIFINSINQPVEHLGNHACQNMIAMVASIVTGSSTLCI